MMILLAKNDFDDDFVEDFKDDFDWQTPEDPPLTIMQDDDFAHQK